MAWFAAALVALAVNVVVYLITPKPKQPKPQAAKDLENPTAEAGREIPVIFGTITIMSPNFLWYGDKSVRTYKVKV